MPGTSYLISKAALIRPQETDCTAEPPDSPSGPSSTASKKVLASGAPSESSGLLREKRADRPESSSWSVIPISIPMIFPSVSGDTSLSSGLK